MREKQGHPFLCFPTSVSILVICWIESPVNKVLTIIEVQIVCKGRLVPGAALWIGYRGEQLPIDFIFSTPIKREISGFPVYTTGFNL
jgi:hypothetical protein